MTDPTPEMVAMSKRLSLKLWPGEDGEYPMERRIAEEAALAAFIETTELAAKLNDEYEAFIRLGSVGDAATARDVCRLFG